MAAVTRADKPGSSYLHEWTLTTADPTGDAIQFPGAPDRSVQVQGTWGGATFVLEGSNQETPTVWFTLTDPQGNAISKTANAMEAVMENVLWIRPRLSAVGAGATISVKLFSRSN